MKVGDDGDVSNYIPNSEWMLVKLHAERNVVYYSCCAEPYPDVTYKIQMRRKPLFYVFNMILPCMLITFVALLGFYVPSDSGEKVTMGITTLLSMTVFLMLVAESMPPTSSVLPLLGELSLFRKCCVWTCLSYPVRECCVRKCLSYPVRECCVRKCLSYPVRECCVRKCLSYPVREYCVRKCLSYPVRE